MYGYPGYFVVFNPTDEDVTANFSYVADLPEQLLAVIFSQSYKYNFTKVSK